jgi:AP-2 complex subunit alpha
MLLYCSIRRRALDLLYGMCDVTNAKEIVEELLQVINLLRVYYCLFTHVFLLPKTESSSLTSQYLNTAEFAMREELSLKAAILAEKFAPELLW